VTSPIEKSLLDIDFAFLTRRTFTPSPAAWGDQALYFLLLDRISDVICHLGHGCSASAVRGVRCDDTTMGFTPLEGLMMGTRAAGFLSSPRGKM
jgi:hypothetical protein